MPGPAETFALFTTACLAGAMNAVAGGGTILTFPALLAFGMPSIQANATSTLALLAGMGGSLYGYRTHLPATAAWLKKFAPASVVGGLLGAWLLTRTNQKFFDALVPFLILFATLLFLLGGVVRRFVGGSAEVEPGVGGTAAAIALQFGVAVYGGYFGAGIGILMLASMGLLGLSHIHQMNAIKTVLAALINVVATLYFIAAGFIIWPQAAIMTLGATLGYFLGAHFSQKIPQHHVRNLVGLIGISLSLVFFWKQFLS